MEMKKNKLYLIDRQLLTTSNKTFNQLELLFPQQLLSEETIGTLEVSEREALKSKLLSSIGILSRHVKELREMSQKKTRALSFIKEKVVGNWRVDQLLANHDT